ncbi:hypothetical protein VaNZ11_002148 [Volvox africanus]|uniref:protein-serine/threonine phosphatase n=1 Tax=Volvox africanus TaxID=51714 RepID=A0ABQ5RRB3_9CHLO|nr:hypothetical protein VaNZ11_002148 [Volvox africanus]
MSVQVGAEPCGFHLKRTLTLDPSGLASTTEGEVQLLSSRRKFPCGEHEPLTSETTVCFACATDRTTSASTPSTPFVSAAVTKDFVSAFQRAQELPCSPGSVFRNQDTVIHTSSSEEASVTTPSGAAGPRLNGTLSTPVQRGSSCAIHPPVPQPLVFQRQSSACLGITGSCPAHGIKAVCGKRNKMEDMYAVQPNFCDIPLSPTADEPQQNKLPLRIAVQLENADQQETPTSSAPLSPAGGVAGQGPAEVDQSVNSYGTSSDTASSSDTLHFFGVYDGHGGCQAAEHCAKRLHHHLSQSIATACGIAIADGNQLLQAPETDISQVDWSISSSLMQSVTKFACLSLGGQDPAPAMAAPPPQLSASLPSSQTCRQPQEKSRLSLAKASVDSDCSNGCGHEHEHVLYPLPENDAMFDNDSSGSSGSDRSDGVSVTCLVEEALKEAFVKTDAEFANDGCAAMVGSTALVALVGTRKVWLANCGDSRAVLCRAGKAIQLTDDHKPEREDEAERVEKAGGQVLFWNGHRVMGVLAMSRAIGDHGLRPYIIPEPEVSVWCRTEDDDFLLLASDGLWDVMANQEATNLCIRCIKRAREKGASRNAALRIAASVLTKAAIDRGSKDNVTVVIVDLRSERPGAAPAPGATCADAADKNASSASTALPLLQQPAIECGCKGLAEEQRCDTKS